MNQPIIVVGDLMVDIVTLAEKSLRHASDTRAKISTRWGGAGANTAAWLAHTHTPCVFVTRIGEDPLGRLAIHTLRKMGVGVLVTVDTNQHTGMCVVLVEPDGERTMLPDRGANLLLTENDLPSNLFEETRRTRPLSKQADAADPSDAHRAHLHLSGYVLLDNSCRPAGIAALNLADASGMTTSVDPASAAPILDIGAKKFLSFVEGVDLLLPNANEATALTGNGDPEQAAMTLTAYAKEVIVKLGAQGALWCDGKEIIRAVTPEIGPPLDTTGAGDCFTAGWLSARARGTDVTQALQAACTLAAHSVQHRGAWPPIP